MEVPVIGLHGGAEFSGNAHGLVPFVADTPACPDSLEVLAVAAVAFQAHHFLDVGP